MWIVFCCFVLVFRLACGFHTLVSCPGHRLPLLVTPRLAPRLHERHGSTSSGSSTISYLRLLTSVVIASLIAIGSSRSGRAWRALVADHGVVELESVARPVAFLRMPVVPRGQRPAKPTTARLAAPMGWVGHLAAAAAIASTSRRNHVRHQRVPIPHGTTLRGQGAILQQLYVGGRRSLIYRPWPRRRQRARQKH